MLAAVNGNTAPVFRSGISVVHLLEEKYMRAPMRLIVALLVTIGSGIPLLGQITSNPLPAPIEKRGLAVQIKDLVRLPDTPRPPSPHQDGSPPRGARGRFFRGLP